MQEVSPVGRVSFAGGKQIEYAAPVEYLKAIREELPYRATSGFRFETLTSNPIVSLGGALPVVIALLCSMWCVRVSVSPSLNTAIKVFCCLGISALAWGLWGMLMFVMLIV